MKWVLGLLSEIIVSLTDDLAKAARQALKCSQEEPKGQFPNTEWCSVYLQNKVSPRLTAPWGKKKPKSRETTDLAVR